MGIIIVGGVIYESHKPRGDGPSSNPNTSLSEQDDLTDTTAAVWISISLVPSSMKLLKDIDTGLYDIFQTRSYVNESYTFKATNVSVTLTGDKGPPPEHTVSCPRYGLWECLPDIIGDEEIQNPKVAVVDLSGKKPIIKFADGDEEDADLVIGAGSVNSFSALFSAGTYNEYRLFPSGQLESQLIKLALGYCTGPPIPDPSGRTALHGREAVEMGASSVDVVEVSREMLRIGEDIEKPRLPVKAKSENTGRVRFFEADERTA
ncbi:hypothetical protein DL769_003823 [Monosporascus sp. CRB-8-3]|nr:hypothetical protein DL769_003823 [Monosporascus sp. CRB-8-3]